MATIDTLVFRFCHEIGFLLETVPTSVRLYLADILVVCLDLNGHGNGGRLDILSFSGGCWPSHSWRYCIAHLMAIDEILFLPVLIRDLDRALR